MPVIAKPRDPERGRRPSRGFDSLWSLTTIPSKRSASRDRGTAYIALGSNLDDRFGYLEEALQLLRTTAGVRLAAMSQIVEYDAVGGPPQGKFLNAVVAVETSLSAEALAARLKAIEREMGRRPSSVQWGPRIIDLDLLLHGDAVVSTKALTVPHPRMHERRFVLEPLNQIAPYAHHPVLQKKIHELLDQLIATS